MTYIIGECGSNWSTQDDCLKSIRLAKLAGADAVKFQAFTPQALYGLKLRHCDPCPENDGKPAVHPNFSDELYALVMKPFTRTKKLPDGTEYTNGSGYILPLDWLPAMKAKADEVGIDFLCSAFSPELIEAVDPFVSQHKVASAEACHVRMLETYRRIGKPVILSCGGKGEADIAQSLKVLGDTPVTLMYCVSAYPAQEIDLHVMLLMRDRFKVPVGFSDHSTDVLAIPFQAAEYGATVIEKHVNFVEATGPDAPHSINFDQFKRMIDKIQGRHISEIGYTREERGMLLRHNRRLLASAAIEPGVPLVENVNFGIWRSLHEETRGLSPFAIDQVNGKRATRAIAAGEAIGPGDFESDMRGMFRCERKSAEDLAEIYPPK